MRDLRKPLMCYFGEEDSFMVFHLSNKPQVGSITYEGHTLWYDINRAITDATIYDSTPVNDVMYIVKEMGLSFVNIEQLPTYKLRFPEEFRGIVKHLESGKAVYLH